MKNLMEYALAEIQFRHGREAILDRESAVIEQLPVTEDSARIYGLACPVARVRVPFLRHFENGIGEVYFSAEELAMFLPGECGTHLLGQAVLLGKYAGGECSEYDAACARAEGIGQL